MFENTYLVTDELETYSHAEADAAEAALGTRFSDGYREFSLLGTAADIDTTEQISLHAP